MKFESKLIDITNLTDSVKRLVFDKPSDFKFKEGQFVTVVFRKNDKKIARQYSIASSNFSSHLELCVKLIPNGPCSNYLHSLRIGDKITLIGPGGKFILNDNNKKKIFLSTGTGVAPFKSMIDTEIYKPDRTLVLLTGHRYSHEILYYNQFKQYNNHHQNFYYYPVVSRLVNKNNEFFRSGYITDHFNLIEKCINHSDIYICGLNDMVDCTYKKLLEIGGNKQLIHLEKYDN